MKRNGLKFLFMGLLLPAIMAVNTCQIGGLTPLKTYVYQPSGFPLYGSPEICMETSLNGVGVKYDMLCPNGTACTVALEAPASTRVQVGFWESYSSHCDTWLGEGKLTVNGVHVTGRMKYDQPDHQGWRVYETGSANQIINPTGSGIEATPNQYMVVSEIDALLVMLGPECKGLSAPSFYGDMTNWVGRPLDIRQARQSPALAVYLGQFGIPGPGSNWPTMRWVYMDQTGKFIPPSCLAVTMTRSNCMAVGLNSQNQYAAQVVDNGGQYCP